MSGRSHPECWVGDRYEHVDCVRRSGQECVNCGESAGTMWGPYWCPPCDVERLDRIYASLEAMAKEMRDA